MGAPGTKHYAKGTRFEHDVMNDLHDNHGFACMRAAGSKGSTKIDVIAFRPGFPLLFIQAKSGGASCSKEEWDRLFQVASWYPGAAIPVIALKVSGQRKPVYFRITGEKIPYAREGGQRWQQLVIPPHDHDLTDDLMLG
jgi:Holliday junction resolvase